MEMKDGLTVILAAGAGLALYEISRMLAKPPPEGEGAEIGIVILGPDGQPVPKNSPVSLLEGESYIVQVIVTNATTKAGVPWEATLGVATYADGAVVYFYTSVSRDEYFSPGETRTFNYPLNVPMGQGGESGKVWAWVSDPAGIQLGRTNEEITIETIAIIYGATILIGV